MQEQPQAIAAPLTRGRSRRFRRLLAVAPACLLTWCTAVADDPAVVAEKELIITDLSVVEDPVRTTWDVGHSQAGVWTFGRLAAALGASELNGALPETDPWLVEMTVFIRGWLDDHLCEIDVVTENFHADARPGMQEFIDGWEKISEIHGLPTFQYDVCTDGTIETVRALDFRAAPFRLLAIVNRVDLYECPPDGHAGELRFVYGFLVPDDPDTPSEDLDDWVPIDATVILEYRVPKFTATEIQQWAASWHDLGSMPFGEAYNDALATLTEQVVLTNGDRGPREDYPEFHNGNWLLTLRTNERAFDESGTTEDTISEMGEFRYAPTSIDELSVLNYRRVEQTVDSEFNGPAGSAPDPTPPIVLTNYACTNEDAILNNNFEIPMQHCYNDVTYQFRASTSLHDTTQFGYLLDVPYQVRISDFVWHIDDDLTFDCGGFSWCDLTFDCEGDTGQARFNFAIASCVGCHGREADVFDFHHVRPRMDGAESVLSEFLTGVPLTLPFPPPAGFDQLAGIADPRCPATQRITEPEFERRARVLCEVLDGPCPPPGPGF